MEAFDEFIEMEEIEEYWDDPVPDDCTEKDKSRAKRRKLDAKKAVRKRKLAKELYPSDGESEWEYYNNLHQYSKNKIHCSCPLCRAKTSKKKNKYGSLERNSKNWKHSDKKKIEATKEKAEQFRTDETLND